MVTLPNESKRNLESLIGFFFVLNIEHFFLTVFTVSAMYSVSALSVPASTKKKIKSRREVLCQRLRH